VERSNAGIVSLEEDPGALGAISRGAKYAGWVAATPLVAGMTSVAALAWATPWVDLADAVDIASAPAIGLGYVFQGLVGFPAKGVLSLGTDVRGSERARPSDRTAGRPFVPWGFVVEHLEAKRPARPAEEVPRSVQDYYGLNHEVLAQTREELSRQVRRARPGQNLIRMPLSSGSFVTTLELYRAARASPSNPRPLVLMTPPTKAAFAARYLALRFARRGIHGAVIASDKALLEPHLAPREVEYRLRDTVVDARTALRVLGEMPEVDPDQLHYFGVSAGGIFGGVLLGVEPTIRRAVLVLPGGDLPRIIRESDESSVIAYRAAWNARGVDAEALQRELRSEVRTDPQHLARFVEPARILLFLGAGDTVVPAATGRALRSALGDPETYTLAGNHDTASLCFGFILRRSERFLLEGR
jgi:dienelactone hydrolase